MLTFPLSLRFKLIAVASQIDVTDAQGASVFYVRQKAFKLKEAVTVYRDATQGQPLYRIATASSTSRRSTRSPTREARRSAC